MSDEHKERILAAMKSFNKRAAAGKVKPARVREPSRVVKIAGPLSEYDEQKAVVKWLRSVHVYHIGSANGASLAGDKWSRQKQWARLSATGCRSGAPDLLLFLPNGRVVGLEMKAKGGRLSDKQKACHEALESLGVPVIVGYGAEDAVAKIQAILADTLA